MTTTGCSLEWDESSLPAWGTAKVASAIVVVESAGAWGRDAVADAGLPAPDDAALYLVRSLGRHAVTPNERTVIVSGGFADEPWIVGGKLTASAVVDFLAGSVADPAHQARFGLTPHAGPVLLVCTNGRRDACCAVRARPVAQAAHDAAPGVVWEVSHIGGHRFAPTAIHLPSGQTFGRLTERDGVQLARASMTDALPGELFSAAKHRGRVDLPPAVQVAETWWRQQHPQLPLTPPVRLSPIDVVEDITRVELPDGRHLAVTVHDGPDLRDSCTKLPKRSQFYAAAEADRQS